MDFGGQQDAGNVADDADHATDAEALLAPCEASPELEFAPTPASWLPSCSTDGEWHTSAASVNGASSSQPACTVSQAVAACEDLQDLQQCGLAVRWPSARTAERPRTKLVTAEPETKEHMTTEPGMTVPASDGQREQEIAWQDLVDLQRSGLAVRWPSSSGSKH